MYAPGHPKMEVVALNYLIGVAGEELVDAPTLLNNVKCIKSSLGSGTNLGPGPILLHDGSWTVKVH